MRLRITFSKSGSLRYTGHLDMQTTWERTIRRAGLPLTYTQGFHPGPKIQIASALPLGFIGHAEIVDIWLDGDLMDRPYLDVLQPAAPPGLTIVSVEQVDEHGPALQTQVAAAEYQVNLLEAIDRSELERKVAEALGVASLLRERRGKQYDLRPLIETLSLLPPDGSGAICLQMRLAAREGATGRPEEVLDILGIPIDMTRIERVRLILKNDIQ
jgi:radical SAM-linked protein